MPWWMILVFIFIALAATFATGIPIALAFAAVNIIGILIVVGPKGSTLFMGSLFDSVTTFTLLAVPMFFLLGEVLFHSRVIDMVMDVTDKWIGKVRARLLYVSLGSGTGLAMLSGAGMADTALLASTLYPDMEKRGYDRRLGIGVITSAGMLAALIPPSALAVLLASVAGISAGRLLMAGLVPGVMTALLYMGYIAVRVSRNPSLAPAYDQAGVSLREKIWLTAKLSPMALIVFSVMGFILLGIATPSEAAATGALAAIVVTAIYRRLNLRVLGKSLTGVARITGMVLFIITGAQAFGQLLAMTGAARGLFDFVTAVDVSPFMILIAIQLTVLVLGFFIDPVAIMLIGIPVVSPLIPAFGWDPVWFYTLFLMNIVAGNISPPFGLALFVVKGVLKHVPIGDIYRAQIPFLIIDLVAIGLVLLVPSIATWLPDRIR